jgi:GNAT superfamily N-acetyltransferase
MMYLLDIDVKCADQPWTRDRWAQEVHNHTGSVVTYYGTPVGFALFKRYTLKGDGGDNCAVELVKLCVKTQYRRQHLGLLLMSGCHKFATDMGCEIIFTIVPEHHLYPPDASVQFLDACGLKPVKPFLRDYFDIDGQEQDGVKFVWQAKPKASFRCG